MERGTVSFRPRMPGIDDLPPDRKAVLQLLLKQGKSYDDLAGLLRIAPETVRERAHDALDRLRPAGGARPPPGRPGRPGAAGPDAAPRDDVAASLPGQQTAWEGASPRRFLEGSAE